MVFWKSKPSYKPKTGDITLDSRQFITVMRTRPKFTEYRQAVGVIPAAQALSDAFAENLRRRGANGYWSLATMPAQSTATTLKFPDDAGLQTFIGAIEQFLDIDLAKMGQRAAYLRKLKAQAANGDLLAQLQADTEPEASYYAPRAVPPPPPGAPPVPPKPQHLVDRSKGQAWLKHGVQGSTTAFDQMVSTYLKLDGTFPFGPDATILKTAWQAMVPQAPAYRGWNNTAAIQKYPSNIGGMKVLNDVIGDLSRTAMPPRGDNAWYGYALYLFAAIITTQAFTDGNKRAARFAYILMLLSGGVPMVVPNARLGATLGDMQ
jgi:hypothetical protein